MLQIGHIFELKNLVKRDKDMVSLDLGRIIGIMVLFIFTCSAYAHHSISPHYDTTKPISFSGVVTDFKFVNPHSFLYVDVEDTDGNINNYQCEMQAAVILRHSGWTDELFAAGEKVTVNGSAARRVPYGCAFGGATLEDGTQVGRSGVIVSSTGAETQSTGSENEPIVDSSDSIFGSWRTANHFRPNGDLVGDLIAFPFDGERPSEEEIGTEQNPFGIYASYLTEAGLAASESFDLIYDDPSLFCGGASIMRAAHEPNGISEISQEGDLIYIKHQYMDVVRTVHTDTREHPGDIQASMAGHSVGWFEDDELIIDTVGFEAGVLFPHPGILHSNQMSVRERLRLSEDNGQLIREYEATDPPNFSKPIPGQTIWNRSDRPLQAFNCIELSGENSARP